MEDIAYFQTICYACNSIKVEYNSKAKSLFILFDPVIQSKKADLNLYRLARHFEGY
jgi:hypothetical protein